MRDPIGRWYDAGFDRLNVIVPEQTWEAINKATRDWQATWLKESQDAITANPKATNWNNLSQSLAAYNNAQKMRTRFVYRSIALVSAFILIPWLISDYSNFNQSELDNGLAIESNLIESTVQNNSNEVQTQEELVSNNRENFSQSTLTNTLNYNVNNADYSSVDNSLIQSTQDELVSHVSVLEVKPVTSIIQSDLNKSLAVNTSVIETTLRDVLSSEEGTEIASTEIDNLPLRAPNGFDLTLNKSLGNGIPGKAFKTYPNPTWLLGVKGNLHANTLLNPMTQMENSGVSGVDNRLSYNVSGGFSARRYFGQKNSFEADLMFGETRRQFTNDSRTGNLITKDISLTYNSLSLVYRRSISPRWKLNEVTVNVGMFGALRSDIQEKWNNQDKLFLSEGFGRTDLGISAGIDYTLVLNRRLRLATGLKYQLGGINIFKGLDYMPSEFYQTYTSSFGLTTGLYYCF